jgi:aryl sulfotransferase
MDRFGLKAKLLATSLSVTESGSEKMTLSKKTNLPQKKREHWHHLLDSTIWNVFKFRDDDIIINAYSKSGTTWVQQIVAQLLWNGAENITLSDVSPWIDCRFPAQEERLARLDAQSHRRFIKSHLPVDTIEFSPQAKYIYIGRDGRDVVWSLYNHHLRMKKDVLKEIDAVSERIGPPLGTATESVLQYFWDWLEKDGYPWWPYWEHILSWWKIRDLPNVMLIHFSNLKKDMPDEIRGLAAFLEIEIDENQWNLILEHCSFDYMKNHAAQSVPFMGEIFDGGAETFMHKGVNGRWKDLLSSEEIERYERIAQENLGAECASWLSTGSFPKFRNFQEHNDLDPIEE